MKKPCKGRRFSAKFTNKIIRTTSHENRVSEADRKIDSIPTLVAFRYIHVMLDIAGCLPISYNKVEPSKLITFKYFLMVTLNSIVCVVLSSWIIIHMTSLYKIHSLWFIIYVSSFTVNYISSILIYARSFQYRKNIIQYWKHFKNLTVQNTICFKLLPLMVLGQMAVPVIFSFYVFPSGELPFSLIPSFFLPAIIDTYGKTHQGTIVRLLRNVRKEYRSTEIWEVDKIIQLKHQVIELKECFNQGSKVRLYYRRLK